MFWTTVTTLILSFEIFGIFELKRWAGLYTEVLTLRERTPESLAEIMKKAGRVEPWAELLVLAGLAGLLSTPAWPFSLAVFLLTILKETMVLFHPSFRRYAIIGNNGPLTAVLLAEGILSISLLVLTLLRLLHKI